MERMDERRRRQPPQSRQADRYDRERPARRSAGDRSAQRSRRQTGYDTAQRPRRRPEYDAPQNARQQYEYSRTQRSRRQYEYDAPQRSRRQSEYDGARRSGRAYGYEPPRRSRYDAPQWRRDPYGYDRPRQSRRRSQTWLNYILPALLLIAVFMMTVVMVFWPRSGSETEAPTEPTVPTQTQTEPPTEEPTEAESKPPAVTTIEGLAQLEVPDYVEVWLIDVDGTSRRGVDLEAINDIVIHYVGNPGTEAWQNREWYSESTSDVSSHFVVGLEGEIIQCIPLNEKSSASNHRNSDTISIEVCHPDASGKFNPESYESLVKLTAWLVERLGMDVDNVIRHYDITGKACPKYYVENETAWVQFKADVAAAIG